MSTLPDNVIWKHFLPVCGSSFHGFNSVFHRAEVLILMKFDLSFIPKIATVLN